MIRDTLFGFKQKELMCVFLWIPYSTDRRMPRWKFSLATWNNSPEDRMDSTASFVEMWSRDFLKTRRKSTETICTSWCCYQTLLWKKPSETPHVPAVTQKRGKPQARLNSHLDSQSQKFRKLGELWIFQNYFHNFERLLASHGIFHSIATAGERSPTHDLTHHSKLAIHVLVVAPMTVLH